MKKKSSEDKLLKSDIQRELKRRKKMTREMATVTYIVVVIFVAMACYCVWFLMGASSKILNNPYNKRQDLMAKRVVRGEILSADQEVLARTKVSKKGVETREYPYAQVFAPVVGRFSHGKTGLESTEAYTLLTSGVTPLESLKNQLKGKKNPGNQVVTTLNTRLSQIAYDSLGGYRGAVVAMDPKTGKILVMVSKPTYNPNTIDRDWDLLEDDSSKLYNRCTQGLYPPGSTFKLYTLLEYMKENTGDPAFTYHCKGKIGEGSEVLHCYGNEVHGKVNLRQAFAKSCNTAFAKIGGQLNREKFRQLCQKFYYNKAVPLEELECKENSFPIDSATSSGDLMQASIGQGQVLTSPLQNALLVSAAVNHGKLMKPYLVDKVLNSYGSILSETESKSIKKPLTSKEAKSLCSYMQSVVQEGTGRGLRTSNYEVGGKTGSAQFEAGSNKSHAWFVGYCKKGKKALVVSIVVEQAGTGSAYAVPIAKKMFDAYLL